MKFIPIKTKLFTPPKDDIYQAFDGKFPELKNWDILFITSKVISIHQWRCISKKNILKQNLIIQEASYFLHNPDIWPNGIDLTITQNTLIPNAGIDESNANNYYILLPNNLPKEIKKLYRFLTKKYKLTKLGIVVTDSTSKPLRYWSIGVAIYSYGFYPLLDKRWNKDLFGRKLEVTKVNIVDSISAIAVYLMGESTEQTPMLIWRNIKNITYTTKDCFKDNVVGLKNDIYSPILKNMLKKNRL